MQKQVTNNDLARMIAKGFENTQEQLDSLKDELVSIKLDIADIKKRLSKLEMRLDDFTEFQNIQIQDLQKRILILERTVKQLSTKKLQQ